jgi:hypothetical protein
MSKLKRTYAEIIVDAFTHSPAQIPVCLLHENMTDVKSTKAGTKLTVGIPANYFSPNDAMWFSGQLGQSAERKPKYVGVIVFVPTELYENKPRQQESDETPIEVMS